MTQCRGCPRISRADRDRRSSAGLRAGVLRLIDRRRRIKIKRSRYQITGLPKTNAIYMHAHTLSFPRTWESIFSGSPIKSGMTDQSGMTVRPGITTHPPCHSHESGNPYARVIPARYPRSISLPPASIAGGFFQRARQRAISFGSRRRGLRISARKQALVIRVTLWPGYRRPERNPVPLPP